MYPCNPYIKPILCLYSPLLNCEDHFEIIQSCVIHEVPHKWKNVGTALGLTYTKTEAIQTEFSSNHDRFVEVLGKWLRNESGTGHQPRTLNTLLQALDSCDCRPEAKDLKEALSELTIGTVGY